MRCTGICTCYEPALDPAQMCRLFGSIITQPSASFLPETGSRQLHSTIWKDMIASSQPMHSYLLPWETTYHCGFDMQLTHVLVQQLRSYSAVS